MGSGLLTDQGLDIMRLDDVQKAMEADFRSKFGANVNLGPDSDLGKIKDIVSGRLADLWERMQELDDGSHPDSASGTQLDRVALVTAATRDPARSSTVVVFLRGSNTAVAAGFLVETTDTGVQFQLIGTVTIPPATDLTNLTTGGHTIVRSGDVATLHYVSHGRTTGDYLWILGLDQDEYNGVHRVTITDADNLTFEVLGSPATPATGSGTGYAATPGNFESVDAGPISALAGSLTQIVNAQGGVDAATNAEDAFLGNPEETDDAFRARRIAALEGIGNATVRAIRGDVLNVFGVTFCDVFENTSDVTDGGGRPPHSIQVAVLGGDDQDIREAIFNSAAGGIETYGAVTGSVTDDEGHVHTINFSRPTDVDVYLTLTLDIDAGYPVDGDALALAAILAYGSSLGVGDDVVVYPYLVAALKDIPGITGIAVDIGTAPSPSGSANITIAETEVARFDSTRITVIDA